MVEALFQYGFLQNALMAGLLASLVCGLIGVIIVEKKLLMMSGGIAHTAYGGVGLGYLAGFEPILGAVVFSVAAALGVGYVRRKGGVQTDITISLFWSLGMALGVAFIAFMPGYPPDMNSYLFGNILSVTQGDLALMAALSAVVTLRVLVFFNDWKAYLFDEQFAGIIGLRTGFLEYLLLVLIALTVVVLIRVAGIMLVLALLTAPAATAALLSKRFKTRMVIAVLLGMAFCFVGLWLSYSFDLPSGASIIIVSILVYAAVYLFTGRRRKRTA